MFDTKTELFIRVFLQDQIWQLMENESSDLISSYSSLPGATEDNSQVHVFPMCDKGGPRADEVQGP